MKKLLSACAACLISVLFTLLNNAYADNTELNGGNYTVNFTTQATASDLDNAQLSLMQSEETIKNAQLNLQNYEEELQAMNIGDANLDVSQQDKETLLKSKIQNQIQLITLNEQRQRALKKTISVFSSQLKSEQKHLNNLNFLDARQRHLARERAIQQKITDLNQEQSIWLNQITLLNNLLYDKSTMPSPTQYKSILEKIFTADENSNITQFKITMLLINNSLSNIFSNLSENASATELNEQRQSLTVTINELEQTQKILTKKIDLLEQRNTMLKEKQNSHHTQLLNTETTIEDFIGQYNQLLTNVNQLLTQATQQQDKTARLLAKALARRQVLPGFNVHEWIILGKELKQMSIMSWQLLRNASADLRTNLTQSDNTTVVKLFGVFALALLGFFGVRALCNKIQRKLPRKPSNFSQRFLVNTLSVFASHLWLITLIIAVTAGLTLLNLSEQQIILTLHLGNTVLVFSIALMAARISLYETTTLHHGADIKLYYRLCWLFSFGFIIRLLMIVADYFNMPYEAQDLFDRAFMLFVFIIALMLLKAAKMVQQLIIPIVNPKQTYLIRTIKLLAILIPLIILSNAVIGLVGYVALAWTISKYEGLFLLVIAIYLVLRGLFNDALDFLVARVLRTRSGWVMTEAFIKPCAFWINVLIFLACAYLLFYLYDVNNQTFVINYYYKFLSFPLMSFSNSTLTVQLLIKATAIGLIAFWATKWTREFCYRKLYRNVRDIGARNSLSTFSQYGVCALGIVITLQVLHIDLTTLAVIAGGLAVGIGFGLRDLMNNFISGFIILIERPVRRGDTVTIGDHEGKIIDIGLRAMTLLSADNREIIVPNSEVFSKTFINWNRHDDVVRSEVSIKVRWQQDPHELQKEIEETIKKTDGIAARPTPEVLLTGMNDGLLSFELRFYYNYSETGSSKIMKSRVLCSVWDRFSALGIHPPYNTQRVLIEKESCQTTEPCHPAAPD